MTYIAYLDEFGHIGPYIGRDDPKHNDSPVFGLAGLVLPIEEVRSFGTWFYQRKSELLAFEIERSGKPAAIWEKKGASLYTVRNVETYQELRRFTNRMFNKITSIGGFAFYVGQGKPHSAEDHDSNALYRHTLREAIKRIDQHCEEDCDPCERFLLTLDEHDQRDALVTQAALAMYGTDQNGAWLSRPSKSRAIAIRQCRPPTGSPASSAAWAPTGKPQKIFRRTEFSRLTSHPA